MVLQQCAIAQAPQEVSTLNPRFTEVLCTGRILPSDAAQSEHDFGRLVHRAGGDVVLFSKDPPRATRADLERFCEDPEADRGTWQSVEQRENGHGRLERRQMTTSPDLNAELRRDWGEVGQVFRVQRERQSKEKRSVEVVSGWTPLSPQRCGPQRLSPVIRAHGAVENRRHWRRDAPLGEDRCGVRFPPLAQMLAVLNSLVLSLMDLPQVANVARQRRRFASHPDEALVWLLDF